MKVFITGSSRVITEARCETALKETNLVGKVTELLLDGHFNVNTVLRNYARKNKIQTKYFMPIVTNGKVDYMTRDLNLLKYADVVVVLVDADSKKVDYFTAIATTCQATILKVPVSDVMHSFQTYKNFSYLEPLPKISSDESFVYVESTPPNTRRHYSSCDDEWTTDDDDQITTSTDTSPSANVSIDSNKVGDYDIQD